MPVLSCLFEVAGQKTAHIRRAFFFLRRASFPGLGITAWSVTTLTPRAEPEGLSTLQEEEAAFGSRP